MADEKKMSVEDILAAARKSDSEKDSAPQPASEKDQPVPENESTGAEQPADMPQAEAGEMSVSDILAAARMEKTPTAKPAAPAKPKAAGAAKTDKPSVAKPASKAKSTGPKDTSSILAAARQQAKPGPVSKSETAASAKSSGASKGKSKLAVPPLPVKPAYAMAQPVADANQQDRRNFMSSFAGAFVGSYLAVGFTTLGLTHLLWLLGFARFMFPNILIEPPSTFRVGFPDDFAPGQVETKFKAQFGVWIARYEYEGQPQIYALRTVCTHLGCTPNWLEGEQKFKCPCHGSGFYKDGINFEGPAPRPLERYAISLTGDGQLLVDKSKLFNEEKGQWKDPASFVSV